MNWKSLAVQLYLCGLFLFVCAFMVMDYQDKRTEVRHEFLMKHPEAAGTDADKSLAESGGALGWEPLPLVLVGGGLLSCSAATVVWDSARKRRQDKDGKSKQP